MLTPLVSTETIQQLVEQSVEILQLSCVWLEIYLGDSSMQDII